MKDLEKDRPEVINTILLHPNKADHPINAKLARCPLHPKYQDKHPMLYLMQDHGEVLTQPNPDKLKLHHNLHHQPQQGFQKDKYQKGTKTFIFLNPLLYHLFALNVQILMYVPIKIKHAHLAHLVEDAQHHLLNVKKYQTLNLATQAICLNQF
jgi:hypothetical protein